MSDSIENITEDKTQKVDKTIMNTKLTDKGEVKYLLNDLIDNCKALGYKKEIVAGAFFNCNKTEMTKNEFQETIKNFLGKRVK